MKGVFIPEITVEMLKSASLEAIEDFFSGIINDDNNDEKVTIVDAEVPQWIPCSERLPERDQICIVTDETRRNTYEYGFHDETYDEETGWTYLGHKIIAWMPLPEPYQEGEQDEIN